MARLANKQREAENVSAWLFGRGEALALSSLNANTGPIYNVRFEVFFKPNRATLEPSVLIDDLTYMTFAPAETLDQTQSLSSYHPDNYVYVKTDDGKELNYVGNEVVPVRKRMDFRIWDGKSHTTGFAVRMSFRDSAGVRWQRDWTGKLTEIKEAS